MTVATSTVAAPRASLLSALTPLGIEVGIPVAAYFVARDVFDASILGAFVISSVPPLLTSALSMLRTRRLNGVSALVLAVNVAGLAGSYLSGGIRLTFAVNAATSIVIGLSFLLSSWRGRPITSVAAKPWITRGDPARDAAYEAMLAGSEQFRALDRRGGFVWGAAFAVDSIARIALAVVAPVALLGWIATPVLIVTLVVAAIGSGAVATEPMTTLVDERLAAV